jgi:hypothetical protein
MTIAAEIHPFRSTWLELETREPSRMVRPPWDYQRKASEISRAPTEQYGASSKVFLVQGDAWILAPLAGDTTRSLTSPYSAANVRAAALTLAGGFAEKPTWKKPDQPGIGATSDFLSLAAYQFVKRPLAAASFEKNLAADQTAYPGPTLDTTDVPLDRVAVGTTSYPPRTPFAFNFVVGMNLVGVDNLASFYFGGPTATTVEGETGGEFCLNFRGSGQAVLFEREGTAWKERFRFEYAPHDAQVKGAPGIRGGIIIPYGIDRIAFMALGASGLFVPLLSSTLPAFLGATVHRSLFIDNLASAGHAHKHNITGTGPIRVDLQREFRSFGPVLRMIYPTGGTLIDRPFRIPFKVREGMLMRLDVKKDTPGDTILEATVYNATTKNPISTDADGLWQLDAGQQDYYIIFDYASTAQEYTPVLYSYSVSIDRLMEVQDPVVIQVRPDLMSGTSMTGGGAEPGTESASCVVEDRYGEADVLRTRRRIRTKIFTEIDAGDPTETSVYFDGETFADGSFTTLKHPLGESVYYRHELSFASLWGKRGTHINRKSRDYSEDPDAPVDPALGNTRPAWKFTDIIKDLLKLAGEPEDEINIPDLDVRLWKGAGYPSIEADFRVQPQIPLGQAILKYAREYLGWFIVREGNMGARGQWTLIAPPAPPYTPVAEFLFGPPASVVGPHLPTHHGTYSGGSVPRTFILDGTYQEYLYPPEGNFVEVFGAAPSSNSNQAGTTSFQQSLWNPASFNLDPDNPTATDETHPDFLGEFRGILYVDHTLFTQEAVNYVCRRLYDRACHAERRRHFRSPLILIEDPECTRPRPLRMGDIATIPIDKEGTPGTAVLASNPGKVIESDTRHWGDYEFIIAEDAEAEEG